MDDSSTSTDSVPALPAYFPSSNPNGYPPTLVNRPPSCRPPASRPPALLPPTNPPHPPHPSNFEGHSNPLYQSSRPNSVYSISAHVDMESRPPSAHSSYSNWHGQRPSMPLPSPSSRNANLHGHSPTPSVATNTFGVPAGQVTTANGYGRSAVYYNGLSGQGHG